MKRLNIANVYQKQKYAKYELCKKVSTKNLLCKPQTVQGKFMIRVGLIPKRVGYTMYKRQNFANL